jgi:hypothetical protein
MIFLTITATDPDRPKTVVEPTFTDSAWVEQDQLADDTIVNLLSRLNDRLEEEPERTMK